ncbi:papain family cysteine protease (macronuclear) [Tetrahymena thermophila SB210]|uniref:Papain family cysteine protease n=1 Tax=Tetrahymena thermophila (strain SB210) TaxID=312017 RepID=Q23FP8_TETTS|nr:papain family cysteine protease [Tetrahymena thermophila SB210]EAR95562.2 papain family cysteine protease [Tetrahymena thermophila SB210]|eukprot:XP_001015807.2 papain family cysteine protease [Tetrahymena thermophila SB210]
MRKSVICILLLGCLLSAQVNCFNFTSFSEKFVEEFNKRYNSTWRAARYQKFEEMDPETLQGHLGALIDEPLWAKLPIKNVEQTNDPIPESFDSREQWPNCNSIKTIRDQSTCGSCWAFAATETYSDRICIASNQELQTSISSEDLLECCATCGNGCQGGYPSAAWKYMKATGVSTGGLYGDDSSCKPYVFPPCDHHVVGQYPPCGPIKPTPKCVKQCNSQYTEKTYQQDLHHPSKVYQLPNNAEAIQREIMAHGPVQASFRVASDFLTYKSGVYIRDPKLKYEGGHSVKIIGWGVEQGTPYWLIANSWNEDWGENGLFKMLRGKNECGIEAEVVAGLP